VVKLLDHGGENGNFYMGNINGSINEIIDIQIVVCQEKLIEGRNKIINQKKKEKKLKQ
jgi:hypothetical protein